MNQTTKTVTVGGVAVAVAVFISSIIGSGYQGGILSHIDDVINGKNTQPVVSLNAPNWESGLFMQSPLITSIATSSHANAASGLASSTSYTFGIAALDSYGTTTLISFATQATDASTTQPRPEDIILKWNAVPGATGYAIFFGTTTTQNSANLTQYFLATTSGQYDFSTSTGSIAGSYTKSNTTAYENLLNPAGPSWFNSGLTSATSTAPASTTALQVNGTAVFSASATTTACETDTTGAIFFNTSNGHEWGCNGSTWTKIF